MDGEMSKSERVSYIYEQINQLEVEAHRVFMDMEKIPEWQLDSAEEHHKMLRQEIEFWQDELDDLTK